MSRDELSMEEGAWIVFIVSIILCVGFFIGFLSFGQAPTATQREDQAIELGYAKIVIEKGKRKFEWVVPKEKP